MTPLIIIEIKKDCKNEQKTATIKKVKKKEKKYKIKINKGCKKKQHKNREIYVTKKRI